MRGVRCIAGTPVRTGESVTVSYAYTIVAHQKLVGAILAADRTASKSMAT